MYVQFIVTFTVYKSFQEEEILDKKKKTPLDNSEQTPSTPHFPKYYAVQFVA
jgi:hypothetical protein